MTECTRCGTQTNNPALDGTGIQSTGILEVDDYNGVVWLCDGCGEEFREWLSEEEMLL